MSLPKFITDQSLPLVAGQLYVIAMRLPDGSDSVDHLIAEWEPALKSEDSEESNSYFLLHTPCDTYGDLIEVEDVLGYFPFTAFFDQERQS